MHGEDPYEGGDATASASPTAALTRSPAAGTTDAAGTELGSGDLLGVWRLQRRLGQGGMGAVYLAERADGHFEQLAAIKLIRGTPDAQALIQFARERQILAALQHPHIARLLDGGATPGGQPYLVMEYVEGEPIDAYCRRRGLGLPARLVLFQQVCRAVQFAHQRLIVHCDLKPSNVLVRKDGTPVLLDFGIARALDRQRVQEIVGSSYMTPGYASPEQLRGEAVSTASDVFALGLILFELITGRRARMDHDDRTVTQLRTAVVRPSQLADAVPWKARLSGDLDAIVLRASADLPADRYASAEDLARDIDRYVAHQPVRARAPTMRYRFAKLLRRRWPVVTAAALFALLIAGFTWRLVVARDHARAAERAARVHAVTAQKVSDFLVSVFDVSNPQLNQDREISARAVLDEGAKRIESELVDEPQTKAKLLRTLATAYRHIGAPARSVELFREAIRLYLDPRVNDPLAAAEASSELAVVESNDIPGSDALSDARRSLALRERYAPNDPLAMGDAYNTLGIVLEAKDQFDEAEKALRKSLELRRAGHADPSTIASCLNNLGLVVASRSDAKSALPYFAEALKLRESSTGTHSTGYQNALEHYGTHLVRAGNYAEGVPILERNLALCIDLYGNDSTHTGSAHNELGSAVHDLGRFREAAAHYREAMRIDTEKIGADAAMLPLNNLASAYEDMGDYAQALPLFERSLASRQKALAADDARVSRAKQNLARVLLEMHDTARAQPLIEEALAAFRKRFGENNVNTVKAEFALGTLYGLTGRHAELTALLDTLHAGTIELTPLMTARMHALEAQAAEASHDTDAALAALRQAWEAMRTAFGDAHPQTAEFAVAYASALAEHAHADEAKALVAPYVAVI
ncbi:MAG: serine/threonine-protein kinase, partial [Dokdonella sp.]